MSIQSHTAYIPMGNSQIDVAMQYGSKSPTDMRDASDLGRYGLGLKTASLSQCRVLTVVSNQGNTVIGRRWDLDYVIKTGRWSLLVLDGDDLEQVPHVTDLKEQESGTLVVWQSVDRLFMGEVNYEKSLGRKMDDVRQHLGLVFHRYRHLRRTGFCPDPGFIALDFPGRQVRSRAKEKRRSAPPSRQTLQRRSCRSPALHYPPLRVKAPSC